MTCHLPFPHLLHIFILLALQDISSSWDSCAVFSYLKYLCIFSNQVMFKLFLVDYVTKRARAFFLICFFSIPSSSQKQDIPLLMMVVRDFKISFYPWNVSLSQKYIFSIFFTIKLINFFYIHMYILNV